MSVASRAAARKVAWTRVLMAAPLVVLLFALMIYPVGQLLALSFEDHGAFSLAQYRHLFHSPVYVDVLLTTLDISLATTALCVLIGYPVAYLASTVSKKTQSMLLFWVLLSFWTSFLVRAFAWIIILQRNGVINKLLMAIGVIDHPGNLIYNRGAVLIGMVHALLPLAILTMMSVMENIDRNLPRAASTLGARPGTQFWKVYFPLSLPGVTAAAVMVFVTAIGFFIVPQLLGGRRDTMITQLIIDQVLQTLNWGFAGAISVLLLVVVLVIFVIYDRLLGLSSMTGAAAAGRTMARRGGGLASRLGDAALSALGVASDYLLALMPRRKPDARFTLLKLFVWTLLVIITVPALLMIPLSFSGGGLNWPPHGLTLRWYAQVVQSPLWSQALVRSLVVGIGTAILSMLIGTPMSFLLARAEIRGKAAILAFVLLPIIVPRMIIAVGMFYVFARIGLVGSAFGLILGHTVVAVPYVVLTMTAVLRNYDTRLDLAAHSLGARPLPTLRYVTFPILAAGIASAFLFAFATSFDDLTIALFTSGGLTATLPKQFWDEVTLQVSPEIAAVSTCLFLFVAALIFLAEGLRRRGAAA